MIHYIIGWLGAFFFAICAIPQAIKTWRTKRAEDLSWLFLLFWISGELLTFSYILADDIMLKITHFPLYINYAFNITVASYLVYAKKRYK